jgi:hypothetical protein
LASAAAIAAIIAALAIGFTRLDTYDGKSQVSGDAPAWSAPCFQHEPRHDRSLLARCARATGVVSYVRRRGSTHVREVHFALVGRFGALIVKLGDPKLLRTPSLGSRVTVVGALVRASNGRREIEAWSLH